MTRKTALIAGASGLIGRRLAELLLGAGDWNVIGLARHPTGHPGVRWIAVDMCDMEDCKRKLGSLSDVTHLFYTARYDFRQGIRESVDINAAMLRNSVQVVDAVAQLQHVHAVHGGKYYGTYLRSVPGPIDEDQTPRAPEPNFYYVQEDFLRDYSRGKQWTYTTTRPHAFCDPAPDFPRSIGLVIAVLATIQRELGMNFDFPGSAAAHESRCEYTEVGLLARSIAWMAQEPRCSNLSFNIVNGDNPRWSDMWPHFASWLGMKAGNASNIRLTEFMADKEQLWSDIVTKYALRPTRLSDFVSWSYGDHHCEQDWDVTFSMAKARKLGFSETVDSTDMFIRQFETYRAEKIIP